MVVGEGVIVADFVTARKVRVLDGSIREGSSFTSSGDGLHPDPKMMINKIMILNILILIFYL